MSELYILYDDAAIVLCEKPIGLSSQTTDGDSDLPTALTRYFADRGERVTPYVLHRLDTAVGGLMVYAKTKEAAGALSREIAEGNTVKEYLAVVSGDVAASLGEEGELFDYLFKDSRKNKSFAVKKKRQGVKDARLLYRVIGKRAYEGGVLSLVAITLLTGRTHQIRVQFSSRGFPLFGDGKYGSRLKGEIALFSCALTLTHPTTGERMRYTLPMPDRMPFGLFREVTL